MTHDSKQLLNFAVIGCGMHAQQSHLLNLGRSNKSNLLVCCDRDEKTLATCREKFRPARTTTDYVDAIQDPEVDAIVLATTEAFRIPAIKCAAEAGKPVYCEKPLADSLETMYAIREIVRSSGIPFCVGHNRRSAPATLAAHQIFRGHMETPAPCPWRFDREGANRPQLEEDGVAAMSITINDDWYSWKHHAFHHPHGAMLFEMTHFTDLCNWFLAAKPVTVSALEPNALNHCVLIQYETGEVANILMTGNGTFGWPKELYQMFGNGGAVINIHNIEVRTAGIANAPAKQTFTLGKDGFPEAGLQGGLEGWLDKAAASMAAQASNNEPAKNPSCGGDPNKGHLEALERFAHQITGHGDEVCGVDSAILATEVCFAAIQSAQEGRAVGMEEIAAARQ